MSGLPIAVAFVVGMTLFAGWVLLLVRSSIVREPAGHRTPSPVVPPDHLVLAPLTQAALAPLAEAEPVPAPAAAVPAPGPVEPPASSESLEDPLPVPVSPVPVGPVPAGPAGGRATAWRRAAVRFALSTLLVLGAYAGGVRSSEHRSI